jgi:hypothetical protein
VDDTWTHDDDDDDQQDLASVLDFSAPASLDDDVAQPDDVAPVEDLHDPDSPEFVVTNPPGTVTVVAGLDGRVRSIRLAGRLGGLTESMLAEEIVVVAGLATQDARAAQYSFMLDGMRDQGHDTVATRDFLERDLELPSPEQATASRAAVFSQRYAGNDD